MFRLSLVLDQIFDLILKIRPNACCHLKNVCKLGLRPEFGLRTKSDLLYEVTHCLFSLKKTAGNYDFCEIYERHWNLHCVNIHSISIICEYCVLYLYVAKLTIGMLLILRVQMMYWLWVWVVENEQEQPGSRQCDEREHYHVMLPLVIVAVEEVIAMTDPVLQRDTHDTTDWPDSWHCHRILTITLISTTYRLCTQHNAA